MFSSNEKVYQTLKWPISLYGVVASYYFSMIHGMVWFSLHPFLMFVAFATLAPAAILIKKIGGLINTTNHGYLMMLATSLSLFGWYVIYSNKEAKGKPHLESYHAQLVS